MAAETKKDLSEGDAKKDAVQAIKDGAKKIELNKKGETWTLVTS